MLQVPRRRQHISVALPASFTLDIPHLREKTARIGFVARAIAMFRVEEIRVYTDHSTNAVEREAKLVEKILRFQETPQYLRRELFKMDPDLAFSGVLPPLRAPHHPDPANPRRGMVREAIVIAGGAVSMVNAGFREPVHVRAKLAPNARVTIRVTSVGQQIEAELVERERLAIYWGPKVYRDNRTLGTIIEQGNQDLTISTSRRGTDIRETMGLLQERWISSQRPLIMFGAPTEGVPEILARTGGNMSLTDFNINAVPRQGVETIRTEEALLATLAVLNLIKEA